MMTLFGPEPDVFKKCTKCLIELPLSKFSPSGGGKYLRSKCKKCERKLSKEREELKKGLYKPPSNYKCPICLRSTDEVSGLGGKYVGPWCADHDHSTKKFRGWLCHDCNRALGNFKDNVVLLQRAINYLNK